MPLFTQRTKTIAGTLLTFVVTFAGLWFLFSSSLLPDFQNYGWRGALPIFVWVAAEIIASIASVLQWRSSRPIFAKIASAAASFNLVMVLGFGVILLLAKLFLP